MGYLCIDACSTRPAIPDHYAQQILLHNALRKSVDVFSWSGSSGADQDAWTRYIHLDNGRMDVEDKFLPWLGNLPIVMLLQHNSSHNPGTEKGMIKQSLPCSVFIFVTLSFIQIQTRIGNICTSVTPAPSYTISPTVSATFLLFPSTSQLLLITKLFAGICHMLTWLQEEFPF